ncbi:PREDICTED: probable C-mannosyltransferase DPY19L2 [Colobus angolensis palliatus]|uniref:probable C-mannosyltransferase DPY19L2 n=1 Tax=Colobus angolensis palliatus TaxID=336983 RepID=UPI0005F3A04C|nr:PREDICTED: probable C-mannosyltransferase DPY19L2 [Colobus angolensis palliatus]
MRKQGVSSKPLQSPRPRQPKRRREASLARKPEVEEEVGRSALCGGNLPRGARRSSPPRIRNLRAPKGLEREVMANTFLLGPFQFVRNFLVQLREKVQELQARRLSIRTTLGIGTLLFLLQDHY